MSNKSIRKQRAYENSLPTVCVSASARDMEKLADYLAKSEGGYRITVTHDCTVYEVKAECDHIALEFAAKQFGELVAYPRKVWHWFIEWCPSCKNNASQGPVLDVEGEDCNLFAKVDAYKDTQQGERPYKCCCGCVLQPRYSLGHKKAQTA